MFQKILVCVDASISSEKAFLEALALAKATGGNLMLVHVLSSDDEDAPKLPFSQILDFSRILDDRPLKIYLEEWDIYEKKGLTLLNSRTEIATAAGILVEFSQPTGHPGRKICELALEWEADLIITGRRRNSTFKEIVLGSTSNYVMHHAPCSVLIASCLPKAG